MIVYLPFTLVASVPNNMNRAELIASVRAEYELLATLSGNAGVRERDKKRLYGLLSAEDEPAPPAEPVVVHGLRVCAKNFVLFIFEFANVQVNARNHTTRRMRKRMGDKMEKVGNMLYFRSHDMGYAFECMLNVLAHDSSQDKTETGTRVSDDVLQFLRSHKEKILELYEAHINSRGV